MVGRRGSPRRRMIPFCHLWAPAHLPIRHPRPLHDVWSPGEFTAGHAAGNFLPLISECRESTSRAVRNGTERGVIR